eukprot:11106911-Prorocentrum_lima.AAC.1
MRPRGGLRSWDGVPYEAYKHSQHARRLLQDMGNHLFVAAATGAALLPLSLIHISEPTRLDVI